MDKKDKFLYINEKGQQIEFSVWSPYFLEDIEGISSISNYIYTSKGMSQDGSTFVSSNLNNRNIIVVGTILQNKEENKNKLINNFNPKLKGRLIYNNKFINCIAETVNINTESKPKFIISLLCPSPYWQDLEEIKEEIALWKGDLEFPLEIINTGIEMGHREPNLIVNVFNGGQINTGMIISLKASATVVNPSLVNINTQEFIKLNTTLQIGQEIRINTNYGSKRVELIENNTIKNAFNLMDWESTFLQLNVGDNLFRYNADTGLDNLEVSIYHNNNYLGV